MTTNQYQSREGRIVSIVQETALDWTFGVALELTAVGGQFVMVSLPGVGEAPISISQANKGFLYLTIRNVGRVTSKIFELAIGDLLFIRGPYGNGFVVDRFANANLIVVAGGTGLAPVRGFINACIQSKKNNTELRVIAGFKSPADILFKEDLAVWQTSAQTTITVDKPVDGWQGETGLVTEHIKKIHPEIIKSSLAIVVGPPLMMKFATLMLVEQGMSPDALTVSFERNMSCGIGKCGHCKIDSTYVCLDGPVFSYVTARHLID